MKEMSFFEKVPLGLKANYARQQSWLSHLCGVIGFLLIAFINENINSNAKCSGQNMKNGMQKLPATPRRQNNSPGGCKTTVDVSNKTANSYFSTH